ILEATRRLNHAGIRAGYFIQFGYSGEDVADIRSTLDLIRAGKPDEIGISVSYPLPGTGFYDRVKQELRDKKNWADSSDLAMLYRGPFTTAFYRELHAYVHRDFKMRRAWRRLKRLIAGQETPRPRHLLALGYAVLNLPLVPISLIRMRFLRARQNEGISKLTPGASEPAVLARS